MNNKQQEEFKIQLRNSILKALNTIKTDPKYDEIKSCYYENFEKISLLIDKFGVKPSIEDITQICDLSYSKMDALLLQELNNGIQKNMFKKDDFL